MAYLNEVVHLGSGLDAGFANRRTVDAGIGLDFYVVFKDGGTGLLNLVPRTLRLLGEAETIGSNDGSILQDDMIAELTVLTDDGVGVNEEIVSGVYMGVKNDVWEENGIVAEDDMVADNYIGPDVGVGADSGRGCDDGCGVDPRSIDGRRVEELDGLSEGEIWIFNAKCGCSDVWEGAFYQDSRCLSSASERSVFGVGDEGQIAGNRGFKTSYAKDFSSGIAVECCT